MKTVELDSLVGEHVLDAVDACTEKINTWGDTFEDATAIKFRLDGVVYIAIENPDDGYRSSMKELAVATNAKERKCVNVFAGCEVVAKKKAGNNVTLEFIDATTGKVVLEVGTDNTDDYYPWFVGNFTPENLAINQPSKYEG